MPKLNKFKIVLIGDQGVGKTSIIARFIQDSFETMASPTIGIDFLSKTMQIDGETLRLQIWDTAGQERFRSLIPSYVKDANCCLIVSDVCQRDTFNNLEKWIDFVRESRPQQSLIFFVGNKGDMQEREVQRKELEDFAEKNESTYMEVSAKTGANIHTLFRKVAEKLLASRNVGAQESTEATEKEPQPVRSQKKIKLNTDGTTKTAGQEKCKC